MPANHEFTSEPEPPRPLRAVAFDVAGALAAGVILAFVAFAVSFALPKDYSSSAIVQVSVDSGVTSSKSDAVSAANSLATQYAQLVGTSALQESGGTAVTNENVTATVLANQNLIRVTATEGDKRMAQDAATSAAKELATYISDQGDRAAQQREKSLNARLGDLKAQIMEAQANLDKVAREATRGGSRNSATVTADLNNQANLVSLLITQRNTLLNSQALQAGANNVGSSMLGSSTQASVSSPPTRIVVLIAFLVGCLLGYQGLRLTHGSRPTAAHT